ncbi:signal transduction protein [Actinoplanes sp. NBRC 14428]|uniref:HDOD domain-containing protein n=1 Tax=Pseudosporangium ferrugineum TaxID=439699 RepID=A0A2T0SFM1_9ACTN|nr:response regulator [Pseudosporangium ferrugineum]PRY32201.1 HDOD domain-containing protein [Pseudosporangium ferrugineum]BCJ49554.1 signal transduction protein [Actinoplanes sp. NBRC 14428]
MSGRPRVLFVDDEPRILDGLRRSLRGRRAEWDMEFATSGALALELLARTPFDVVVSDMRMPGMDGAELLAETSRAHPHAARVVLSGHIEPEAIVEVAMAGHRFLIKPSDAESVTAVIEQLLVHTSASHARAARRLAGAVQSVPVLPGHAEHVAGLRAPDTGLETAVRAATGDIGLAAKLLQLSTSRFFGGRPRNSSVESIVHAMGAPMVQAVAAAGERLAPAGWHPGAGPLLEAAWRHAMATARLVERVASPANRPHAQAAALLQDIGRLVCLAGTDATPATVDLAAGTRDGVPFRDVAVELLHLWGVPAPVVAAVAHRDTPHRPEPAGLGVAGALRTAHLLVEQARSGPAAGDHEQELALLLDHPQLRAQATDWRRAAGEALRQAEPPACAAHSCTVPAGRWETKG